MGGRQSISWADEQVRDPFPFITELNQIIKEVMENELILDNVIEKLETSNRDLNNCRFVCSQWKRLATKCIQKRNLKTRKFFRFPNDTILKNYLRTITRGGIDDQFYSCYSLDRSTCTSKYNEKLLKKFIEAQTGKIKGLSLNFHYRSTEEVELILKSQANSLLDLKVVISPLMEIKDEFTSPMNDEDDFQMVQLNSLCFALGFPSVVTSQRARFRNPQVWLSLLEIFLNRIPQGKSVKISFMNCNELGRMIEMFQKYNQIQNLKILFIKSLRRGELRIIEESGVKLQFLCVDPSPNHREGTTEGDQLRLTQEISGFLHTQAKNLEILSWGSMWKFKFPSRMIALKKLRLSVEKHSYDSDSDFENRELTERERPWQKSSLLYSYLFPKLEELEIRSSQLKAFIPPDEFISWFLPPQFATPVKKFGIYYPAINIKILRIISTTFANITSLGIGIYKEFMPNIIGEMEFFKVLWNAEFAPNLQELTIKFSVTEPAMNKRRKKYELDSLFSGFDIPTIRQVSVLASSSYAGYNRVMAQKYDDSESEERIVGSILNYTNLKKLTIYVSNGFYSRKGRLNDFSAFCLFARMENLEFLHLDSAIRVFSRAAVQHLQAKFNKTPMPAPQYLSPEDCIHKMFGTSFHSTKNSLWTLERKPLNLLDANNFDHLEASFGMEESSDDSDSDSNEEDSDSDMDYQGWSA